MKFLPLVFLFGIVATAFSQGEANNWYFGQNAGISFNTTPPTALTDGRLNTLEGCTTISDATGNLLFYTDGSTVYTRNHQIMQNGTGLKGDFSSTTSALIVPQPNTPGIYIVFTVDEPHHFNADNDPGTIDGDGINDGFMYSIVDMSLDNGNGAVVVGQKNIPLTTYDPSDPQESAYKCSEKITAVKSDNCDSFWVITHFIDTYYAFSIDQTGVNTNPVISQVGTAVPISGYRRNALGYLKTSPEGDKLAVAHLGYATLIGENAPGGVLLYDFDNTTGAVSNEVVLYSGDSPYGIEFSQSGERLYTTVGLGDGGVNDSFIMQFDLTLPVDQIAASGTRLRNENGNETSGFSAGALQIGPDGKIYRALFDFSSGAGDFIGVIENPEGLAPNVAYREQGLRVNVDGNRISQIGLPPFIQSIFARSIDIINNGEINNINLNLCEGETYRLIYQDIPGATYTWYVNDVLSTNTTFFLDVTTSGNYRLELDLNDGSCPLIGVANVTYFEIPMVENTPPDENFCDEDNDGSIVLDLSAYDTGIIGNQDPNQFRVRYFSSVADADANTNVLPQNFTTTNNPQTIVARIENLGNIDCYATTSFQVEIFNAPIANPPDPIILCDNADDGDDTNGSIVFDLTSISNQIYNGQSSTLFSISYHTSLSGAENGTDLITDPINAVLTDANSTFVRIENLSNTDCFDIAELPITIHPLPSTNITSLTQCDVVGDTGDGVTLFDLTQVTEQIANSNPDLSVAFYENQTSAEMAANEISSVDRYQNSINQQLFMRITDNTTQCSRISTLDLIVATTTANDAILRLCDDDGIEDGIRQFTLSLANDAVLQGINNTDLEIVYYETNNDALLETNPVDIYTNRIPGTQGQEVVFARVEDAANNCFGINEVALFVDPLPPIEEEANYFLCENESISINTGINESGENPNNFDYLWSTGDSTENIVVSQPGTYEVTVANARTGCVKNQVVQVLSSSVGSIQNIVISDARDNNTVTITISGSGDYEYAIEIDEILSPYQDNPTFDRVPPGFHRIFVQDKNGCGITISEFFAVIGFPKYFTPNGDTFHETWNIQGISSELSSGTLIYIFDRHGKLLKQLTPGGNGWNGNFNGQLMPSSEYWFRVELGDGRVVNGSFSLIR